MRGERTNERGMDGEQVANGLALADQKQTRPISEVYNNAAEAVHSLNGYWLTKRRDGRSDNWMIARYQRGNRSIVYRSCKTTDLTRAVGALTSFAANNPAGNVPPPSRRPEVVYFIQADTGQVKIGTARNTASRLAALRTMSPVGLTVAAVVSGGQEVERAYHRRFADARLHGEWFDRTPEIEAEIERLAPPLNRRPSY